MGYSQENGYVPADITTIIASIMANINVQFQTTYTAETFVGTNFYKYIYAAAQEIQADETKTSEIFLKLQQYFIVINAMISRPAGTPPGIIDRFKDLGYIASVKPITDNSDAGKIFVCVDILDGTHASGNITITSYANLVSGTDDSVTIGATTFTAQAGAATPGTATFQAATSNAATADSLALQINSHATASLVVKATVNGAVVLITAIHGGTGGNAIALAYTDNDTNVGATKSGTALAGGVTDATYAAKKTAICTLLSQICVAGCPTQGLESEAVVLSNGQSFDFKYSLPNRIRTALRLTIALSENNQEVVGAPDQTKLKLLANIQARYQLGKNFEPQKYFAIADAPWAESVLLEYNTDFVPGPDPDSGSWESAVFDAQYDELLLISLEDIELIEV